MLSSRKPSPNVRRVNAAFNEQTAEPAVAFSGDGSSCPVGPTGVWGYIGIVSVADVEAVAVDAEVGAALGPFARGIAADAPAVGRHGNGVVGDGSFPDDRRCSKRSLFSGAL